MAKNFMLLIILDKIKFIVWVMKNNGVLLNCIFLCDIFFLLIRKIKC